MNTTGQGAKNTVTLRGSTDTVSEFFQYALSSVLYQRGIYPAENFEPQRKYNLTVMAVKDPKLTLYLQSVLRQFTGIVISL
jgi:mitotic spindle assembly checkpoint protein MAD2